MENFFSVLGGMGTMATESFIRLINHRTKATKDQEYLNYVLFNHATVPDRTAYILDNKKENPIPYLLDDIEKQNLLKPNFIVLTCNTAHYFFDELQAMTDIPILHMPREAANELIRQNTSGKVAILGTEGSMKAGIYEKEVKKLGFDVVIPDHQLQAKINHLIYHDIKESDFLNKELYYAILEEAIERFDCEKVILGCTELSLMQEYAPENNYPVIDAQSILADRTIERALQNRETIFYN
ncbi:amino acid racemase [Enterococcus villorum]|jgi:aspartate racemase|uniref:Aspartate racemase n=2 Tax=Enterococcus villorum TaxID=112904 RepID=A0A511IYW6_9ENTE|nr:amino acid racemase [Enterococcus villorum]EOH87480.1 aspartate racemase [Enterococcus villorum ATCC 700913]EOW77801.1 aspartate racemase [Enterococcus villorum ATCC 700913]GEL90976.1 aspartate racemase [Enterococcus villorum]